MSPKMRHECSNYVPTSSFPEEAPGLGCEVTRFHDPHHGILGEFSDYVADKKSLSK